MRTIDADALHDTILRDEKLDDKGVNWAVNRIISHILNAPTVEFTEEDAIDKLHETGWLPKHDEAMTNRPKGKWYYNYQNGWHCSICNKSVKDMPTVMGKADFNFCPNCGADMRGEENG